jgi:hypothetical protein
VGDLIAAAVRGFVPRRKQCDDIGSHLRGGRGVGESRGGWWGSLIMGQVSGSPRGDAVARSSTASAAGTHSHRSGTMQWRPPMRMSHDGIGPMPCCSRTHPVRGLAAVGRVKVWSVHDVATEVASPDSSNCGPCGLSTIVGWK